MFGDLRRERLGLLTRAVFLGPIFVTRIVLERQSGDLGEMSRREGFAVQAAARWGAGSPASSPRADSASP